MATRKYVRKTPIPARTARRTAGAARARKPQRAVTVPTTPQLTRIKGPLELQAPPGYVASAIFKWVGLSGNGRVYSLWLLVGRFEEDSSRVPFDPDGADVIRCDIPPGKFLSAAALEPHLRRFLKAEGSLDPDPPTIKR